MENKMKKLIVINFVLFVVMGLQATANASSCLDSKHLEKRVITLDAQMLSEFSVKTQDLVKAGYVSAGEKAIKINLTFGSEIQNDVTFSKSIKSVEGYKQSYEGSLLKGNDSHCVRLTSYVAGRKYERDLVSVKIDKVSQDVKIVKAELYVTKKLSLTTPRNFEKIHDERIRMNGYCFPGACLEYLHPSPDFRKFVIRNDSLDDIKTLKNGIYFLCYKTKEYVEDEKAQIVDVPSTKKINLKRDEAIHFDNLCPKDTPRMAIVAQTRGYSSSVALDGWIFLQAFFFTLGFSNLIHFDFITIEKIYFIIVFYKWMSPTNRAVIYAVEHFKFTVRNPNMLC
jgi:hypothetical protein